MRACGITWPVKRVKSHMLAATHNRPCVVACCLFTNTEEADAASDAVAWGHWRRWDAAQNGSQNQGHRCLAEVGGSKNQLDLGRKAAGGTAATRIVGATGRSHVA
jgi:hypothetical protein